MSLTKILENFREAISDGMSYIAMAHSQDTTGKYLYREKTRSFIAESAFLRIFIAWEEFVESCFLEFMMGELSAAGRKVPTFVTPSNLEHARRLIIGTQKFVDWSNPEVVRRLSVLYFDKGYPFDTFISSINQDLMDMRTIRNSSAHITSTTNQQLDALGTRKLKRPCTNLRVSHLILAIDPSLTTSTTILDYYLQLLDVAAERIANA